MVGSLTFTNDEVTGLERITKYYEVTKELLIFGEQVDPQNRTLAQTINELRNCLDHLMRVVSFKLGLRESNNGEEYVEKNLDKAYGHVYRAAYDTLDWVSLNLKDRIIDELQGFTAETIQAVMPEYFTTIRPRLEEIILDEVTRLRMEKDVAAASEENLVKYGRLTAELSGLVKAIRNKKPALVEHRSRLRRFRRKQLILRIAVDVAVGIVVAILVMAFKN